MKDFQTGTEVLSEVLPNEGVTFGFLLIRRLNLIYFKVDLFLLLKASSLPLFCVFFIIFDSNFFIGYKTQTHMQNQEHIEMPLLKEHFHLFFN